MKVIVKENVYRWTNWKIISKTHEFTKEDARTIHFPVKVAKDGEAVVRYQSALHLVILRKVAPFSQSGVWFGAGLPQAAAGG